MPFLMQLQDVEEPGRLAPFSADIRPGEIIHLVGPNGAGKSTLLARMAGLSTGPGQVRLNERLLNDWPAQELARHRAYLSQHQMPPFAMPVWHYLSLHLQNEAQNGLLTAIAQKLGLGDKLGRQVNHISGGEWQRVRLAAVILQIHRQANASGQLLLLDEPMNSLDVAQQAALDRLLSDLCASGIAIVMSSHDLNHTLRHAHSSWLNCQGQTIACGSTAEVLSEENLTAAYAMEFQRVEVAGHLMLVASQ